MKTQQVKIQAKIRQKQTKNVDRNENQIRFDTSMTVTK